MLLAHAILSSPLPPYLFGGTGIGSEGLEDYVDNGPNTDSSEEAFSDEEDDALCCCVL